jgi:outer membrane lipoprotein-sorting protein
MNPKESLEKQLEQLGQTVSRDDAFVANVMARINAAEPGRIKQNNKLIFRSLIMNRFTKFAAAAVIIMAVILSVTFFNKTVPTASASEFLSEACQALSNINSIHIKAQMRTLPADNFSMIGLKYDFVPIELWKKTDASGQVKWKVEKPGRILAMDGNSTTFLIKPNYVRKSEPWPDIRGYDCGWFGRLVNVKGLIESEYKNAQDSNNTELFIRHETVDGREKLVLEVSDLAKGNYTNDYLKNKFISESDHTKVYHFDAQTKLLESFEIIVHADQNDVLVFEVNDIEYNPKIDDKVFVLDLPGNLIQVKDAEILPNNENYQNMGPKETATAFFNACAKEDWKEVLKFWMMSDVDQRTKEYLGGMEVISIGEPFKSGLYPGWFVPYEIKLKSGYIKKMNLAVRNDNRAKRYMVDGGI